MATRPAKTVDTAESLWSAMEDYRVCMEAHKATYAAMMAAREHLADVLHRLGLVGVTF